MATSLRRTLIPLACLFSLGILALDRIRAQDPAAEPDSPPASKKIAKPYDEAPTPEEVLAAEKVRKKEAKEEQELRDRLENTYWYDVELTAGEPGYSWLLRTRRGKGPDGKLSRDWHLSDQKQLPRVGTWNVKKRDLLFYAEDGRVVAKGTIDKDDEVHGQYYDPDRKQYYGSFQLIEANKRGYNILPFRVIDRNAGK